MFLILEVHNDCCWVVYSILLTWIDNLSFKDQLMTHLCHGFMLDKFDSAYWWARSLNTADIRYFAPAPSTTSSTSPYSSSASQTRPSTTSNLCKYYVMNPRHSSLTYPSTIRKNCDRINTKSPEKHWSWLLFRSRRPGQWSTEGYWSISVDLVQKN